MIINNGAICATAALLLLQLTPLCCNAQKSPSQCEGEICHIYPDTFGKLQNIISSNRHIILNGVEFNVNGSNGFTVIENVSNLTISPAEEQGSIIKCSSESIFGFHLKNSTNISLTGITITNCAFCIPNHTMQYECISQCSVATLVINTSRNVSLLKVNIEYSPGIALAMFDSVFEEPSTAMNNVNYNLTLTHCTISHSSQGSLVIFGTTSVLIERTLISNSSIGIDTYKTDIKIKNVNVSNYTYSSLARGCIMVTEGLKMVNSYIMINKSNITFIGDKFLSGLIVIQSNVYISENSVLQFQKFNDTFLGLSQSTLTLNNNSTMIFTQNNASTMVIYFQSYMSVSNGSTVSITNNILIYGILMLWENCSINVNGGILLIEKNECEFSYMIIALNTILIWENRSIFNVTHNTIKEDSVMFIHNGGWMDFSDSSVVVSNNSLRDESGGLIYNESSLILCAAKLLFEDNKCQNESFLMMANDVNIKMENLSLLTFTHNKIYNMSTLLMMEANFIVHESSVVITNNSMTDSTTALLFLMSSFSLNESFVNFVDNEMDNSFLFLFHDSIWTMSSDSELQLFNNNAFGLFICTNASFSGAVRLVNNTAILDVGVFDAVFSEILFKGTLEVVGNRGEVSGALFVGNSDLYITGRALFLDNHAANGGAISFISSVMHISPNATVNFTKNYAKHLGGAIYISQLSTLSVPLITANQRTSISLQSLPTLSVSTSDQEFSVAAVVKVSA